MLEIKPITDTAKQIDILQRCGIPCREGVFAYQAYEGSSLIGAAQFDIEGSTAVLLAIRQAHGTAEDFEGMFILGRAVLNFLDLCGVKTVVSSPIDEGERRLLKSIGFKETIEGMTISLEGLFDAHCDSHGGCRE